MRKGAALTTVVGLALVLLGACSNGGDDSSTGTTIGNAAPSAATVPVTTPEGGGNLSASAETTAVSTTPATSPPTTVSELRQHADDLLAAVDPKDPATVGALEEIQFTDEGADASAAAIANGAAGDELWAATWVYAGAGTDPAVLAPVFTAADPSTRVMAAAGALALGGAGAGQVLVDLVPDTTELRESEPAVSVGDFAAYTLKRFVAGPDLSAATTPDAVATAWQQWWDAHADSAVFDPSSRTWSGA